MRKNIALQVEQLFEQPGKFAGIEKFKTALESLSESDAPDETYLPEYFQKLYAMRTPVKDEDGNYLYLNPNLAFQDINKINDMVDMLSAINPMIKSPIEMATNFNWYYKDKIMPEDRGWDATLTQAPFPGFVAGQLQKLPESLLEKLAMGGMAEVWLARAPGAGGLGKEVKFLIDEINSRSLNWNIIGFIDDNIKKGTIVHGIPILGGVKWLQGKSINAVCAVGNSEARFKIYSSLKVGLKSH
jgi:hypothetical protein